MSKKKRYWKNLDIYRVIHLQDALQIYLKEIIIFGKFVFFEIKNFKLLLPDKNN